MIIERMFIAARAAKGTFAYFFGESMKAITTVLIAASLGLGIYVTGCETSHTESDKPGFFGGQTHEETTTTKNPITGDLSSTHTEQKTN
jgi:disulfide bond formation protein DsbB